MECVKVDCLISGEIDCADFKAKLLQNKDKPAIINVNIGLFFYLCSLPCMFTHWTVGMSLQGSQTWFDGLPVLQELLLKELLMTLILLFKLLKKVDLRKIASTFIVMELCLDSWCLLLKKYVFPFATIDRQS